MKLGRENMLAKNFLSGVGFEPTPSSEDQNSLLIPYQGTRLCLESGALDHSANLTAGAEDRNFPHNT